MSGVDAAVGPGGNYLAQKHSRRHMRDLFLPQFMDRRTHNEWKALADNAQDWALVKARKVLAEHQPAPSIRSYPLRWRKRLQRSRGTSSRVRPCRTHAG
jgi:trimethylamine:corrinoid methyltransferase-like protein